ncbi:hypothetical protein KKF05_04475 [Patescibacteria group bacterium]|nr:hypothetical protein [Patescibacteria group bacterium]MBU1028583.1 hypothetical protein [Patescibacteria group bacterium]MBU1916127.1 hypothetical protein [Patescibacteria group bacterium]
MIKQATPGILNRFFSNSWIKMILRSYAISLLAVATVYGVLYLTGHAPSTTTAEPGTSQISNFLESTLHFPNIPRWTDILFLPVFIVVLLLNLRSHIRLDETDWRKIPGFCSVVASVVGIFIGIWHGFAIALVYSLIIFWSFVLLMSFITLILFLLLLIYEKVDKAIQGVRQPVFIGSATQHPKGLIYRLIRWLFGLEDDEPPPPRDEPPTD